MERIIYRTELSKSRDSYVAFCPELIMTGFGDSPGEARQALQAEVSAYLEDCEQLGVVEEVLEEAGFYFDGDAWVSGQVNRANNPKMLML